jgi:peptidoglycan/xylan/chitin deacetylase (PgdA/CDA1 family)
MPRARRQALLTVDLPTRVHPHDGDLGGLRPVPRPEDLERQIELTMQTLERCDVRATFFSPAKLASVLPVRLWQQVAARHRIGSLGFDGRPVATMTAESFREDVGAAKRALEDVTGSSVVSHRAPDFVGDDCEPWFFDALAQAGHRLDSSRLVAQPPEGFTGVEPLGETGDAFEVPLMAVAVGSRRFAVVGGSQFRLLPLASIRLLLDRADTLGFRPMVFLHPEDFDAKAAPIEPQGPLAWVARAGEIVRRAGRDTVEEKLEALGYRYAFAPLESVLEQ